LAHLYENGWGTPVDIHKAACWYRQAGDTNRANNLEAPPTAPRPSKVVGFLNAVGVGLDVANDQLAQMNAQAEARNAQLQQQAEAQVAANDARRAQQAEDQRQASAREAAARQVAQTRTASTSPITNYAGTGPAAPPVPYHPTQTQQPGTIVSALCPASGFIPGVMRQSGDTAVGVRCTPGQPINANAPNPGSSSGSGAGSGSSGSGSGSSSGSAGSGNGDQVTSPVPDCVYESYPNGDWTFTNRCNAPVYVQWIVGTYSGSWTIAPGDHTGTGFSGAQIASQAPSYYVCPATFSPKDPGGHTLTHRVPQYHCAKNGAF
jgi:hypothetical protein